ncbi:TetR/AcrR family transcriptional regulator [Mycobacterium sp.]|uniref:TetR/AcrR family transcriptional regulator n=1 Tax=Mycobacterium sp. TaxID=1785 RepID=UPI0025EAD6D3|nr:TetR/AcrR family transcriptional regulator [Mycobacterium sp.]
MPVDDRQVRAAMSMPARRPRVSRATRREEIARRLFAAAEVLLDGGTPFSAISVEQLITGAELARSTFYVYFEDKGALVMELADRVTREVGEAAAAWYKLQPGLTREELKAALNDVVREYIRHRHMLAAVAETAAYDPRVRAQYGEVMEQRAEDMAAGFREQQSAGVIRADLDIASVTPWLAWMIERGLYHLAADSEVHVAERLDGLTTVVWQTLYAHQEKPRRRTRSA